MIEKNNEANFDELFQSNEKYNTSVKLTDEDTKAKAKVYCKEGYAQDLYDAMTNYSCTSGISLSACKDLLVGQIYTVNATQISFDEGIIRTSEENSKTEIVIPFREFSRSIDELARGENTTFKVMITKSNKGQYIGSEKECLSISHRDELFDHFESNTWFTVKIKKLIKGGYVATYKNDVDCFIPGSHAGANVIRDFSKLLNTEINVMVDNYDVSNDLFILSYKKYIKYSMPSMISELRFGHKYSGTLTNKPYDFGMFVEFDGYYTGLIHSSDFDNYDEIRKYYKAGDSIDFYIKNVTKKRDSYRIVLTLYQDEIDSEKRKWDELRNKTENKLFDYEVDSDNNSIRIYVDGESFSVTLRRQDLEKNFDKYPKVKVQKVDPINKNLKFKFVSEE